MGPARRNSGNHHQQQGALLAEHPNILRSMYLLYTPYFYLRSDTVIMISVANIPQKHGTQGFWVSCLKPIPLFCIEDTKWLSEWLGSSPLFWMVSTIAPNCHMKPSKSIISKENSKKKKEKLKKIKAQNFDPLVGNEKGRDKPQSGP